MLRGRVTDAGTAGGRVSTAVPTELAASQTYCCWSEEERLEISREASGRTCNGWMDGWLEGVFYYMHSIIVYNISH